MGIYSQIIFFYWEAQTFEIKGSFKFSRDWLSVRIVQNGKSDLGSLLTKGHDFLRDLALKILALFSFRGVVAIRKDSAKRKG